MLTTLMEKLAAQVCFPFLVYCVGNLNVFDLSTVKKRKPDFAKSIFNLFIKSVIYETPGITRSFLVENKDKPSMFKTEGVNLKVIADRFLSSLKVELLVRLSTLCV